MTTDTSLHLRLAVAEASFPDFEPLSARLGSLGITLTTLAEQNAQDCEALSKQYALALAVHNKPTWTQDEYMKRFDHWETVFIALQASTYVGYSYLTRTENMPDALTQCMTGVRPEWRRKGIGTMLKMAGIAYARAHGYTTIVTCIGRDNLPSLAMNRKLGFH